MSSASRRRSQSSSAKQRAIAPARHRRPASIGVVITAFAILVSLAPLLFLVAAAVDVLQPRGRGRHVRIVAMVLAALAIEVAGLVMLGAVWCVSLGHPSRLERLHFTLQNWWTGALLTAAHTTLGLRVIVEDPEPAQRGNVIVLGRHTSIGDAAIPAVLLGHRHGLAVRYVLKHDLQWDPCIDLVGHRVGHLFVDREDAAGATHDIRRLAQRVDGRGAAVIFPEGTFFTPQRKARAVARLAAGSRPELAARAEQLRHLLPPRPAGTLALLEDAPTADVVVLGHVGFERFTSLAAIRRAVPFREPVRVWVWRVPRAEIPLGDDARVDWLYDQWARLDESITARLASP